VLQTRAFKHGIVLDWYFGPLRDSKGLYSNWSKEYRDRYGGDHMDMAELWTNKGAFQRPHMANLASLMGLPGKVGIDGSKVHQAYKDGEFKEIDVYCMQDVFQTAFIFQRFQYMRGKISLDTYLEAATSLLDHIGQQDDHTDFLAMIDKASVLLESV
jgi:predicted PolB exonuclease-like 3'-5' exonuclease